jgi:hypothetical protein
MPNGLLGINTRSVLVALKSLSFNLHDELHELREYARQQKRSWIWRSFRNLHRLRGKNVPGKHGA